MTMSLSKGVLDLILFNQRCNVDEPILQLLNHKIVKTKEPNEGNAVVRYRLLISDGKSKYGFVMLQTQLNHMIDHGDLNQYAIFRVRDFTCTKSHDKTVIILKNVTVTKNGSEVGNMIGNPIDIQANENDGTMFCDLIKRPAENDHSEDSESKTRNKPPEKGMKLSNSSGFEGRIIPIRKLTPYINKFTIKARVSEKSIIKHYSGQRGNGHFFNMTLSDDSGEIKATAFQSECDKFFPIFVEGYEYFISQGRIKLTNKKYNHTSFDYDMTFSEYSEVQPCLVQELNNNEANNNKCIPIQDILPIASLTTNQKSGWTIQAKIEKKTEVREYSNARGHGNFFNIDLIDKSGRIRATLFKDECKKFYPIIEEGKIYNISNCVIKEANRNYKLYNDYDLTFTNSTRIEEVRTVNDYDVPDLNYDFIQLGDITISKKDENVDIIAMCKKVGELIMFVNPKTTKESRKREIELVDRSLAQIKMTVFGKTADSFNLLENPIIAVKGCKISDFSGISLTELGSTIIKINPKTHKAVELGKWYQYHGGSSEYKILSSITKNNENLAIGKNLLSLHESNFLPVSASGGEGIFYSCIATITLFSSENSLYKACTRPGNGKGCNKKVFDLGNGKYKCDKCDLEMDAFNWKMRLKFQIRDSTGDQLVECFEDPGQKILKVSSEDIGRLFETDIDEYHKVFLRATFLKCHFRLQAKINSYNNKIQHVVKDVEEINILEYTNLMIKELEEKGISV